MRADIRTRAARRLRVASRVLDHRVRFRDLAALPPRRRRPRSPILQFYSAVDNIGNYLPVLGSWDMIGVELDVWNIHDRRIDFDFINQHYSGLIVGGAGLLHKTFEGFWGDFASHARLPAVTWGIGVCLKDSQRELPGDDRSVSVAVVKQALDKCDLVNVRDPLTAAWYDLAGADVSACPTLAHLAEIEDLLPASSSGELNGSVLFAAHEPLAGAEETQVIARVLATAPLDHQRTDNIQTPEFGLYDVLGQYRRSSRVVTSRLHGAIIAFGFGVPYVAIARDEKVRSFVGRYGGGVAIEDVSELEEGLERAPDAGIRNGALTEVRTFGGRVREWAQTL